MENWNTDQKGMTEDKNLSHPHVHVAENNMETNFRKNILSNGRGFMSNTKKNAFRQQSVLCTRCGSKISIGNTFDNYLDSILENAQHLYSEAQKSKDNFSNNELLCEACSKSLEHSISSQEEDANHWNSMSDF